MDLNFLIIFIRLDYNTIQSCNKLSSAYNLLKMLKGSYIEFSKMTNKFA